MKSILAKIEPLHISWFRSFSEAEFSDLPHVVVLTVPNGS